MSPPNRLKSAIDLEDELTLQYGGSKETDKG